MHRCHCASPVDRSRLATAEVEFPRLLQELDEATPINISENLLNRAREVARRERTALNELTEEGLQLAVARRARAQPAKSIPLSSRKKGFPPRFMIAVDTSLLVYTVYKMTIAFAFHGYFDIDRELGQGTPRSVTGSTFGRASTRVHRSNSRANSPRI